MTESQQKLFNHCREKGSITKTKAVELIGNKYYCNASKHTGDVLSRMVKSGLLKRVKKGIYVIGHRTNPNYNPVPDNQLDLFNE